MISDPFQLEVLLSGTPLADLPVGYGPGGTLMMPDVPPAQLVEAWQSVHGLVVTSGRWPLMVTDWGGSLEMQNHPTPGPGAPELAALDRAARTGDPWAAFLPEDRRVTADDVYAEGWRYGLSERAAREVSFPATEAEVGRWVYEQVRADPELSAQIRRDVGYAVSTESWYTPAKVSLLLLPTGMPWLAAAWTSAYNGTLGMPSKLLAAAFWQWSQRWDARLVAFWETMLQFEVRRPPTPGRQAWELAGQLKALAGNLALTQWELAVVLPEGHAWFLHDRP